MDLEKLKSIQGAIQSESLDGWLFCNFRHRDPLADEILGLSPGASNSRFWFYAVPTAGEPQKIAHAVEPEALGTLPGEPHLYRSREELLACLRRLAGKKWGCHFSDTIPAISYLDAGTAAMLKEAGLLLAPGDSLIQRFKGLLNDAAIQSHERTAAHLYEIVELSWAEVQKSFAENRPVYEGDIALIMSEEVKKRGLETRGVFVVAAGRNSGNPHYNYSASSTKKGALFAPGDVIQFDLWAKEHNGVYANGVYADISWVGVYGKTAAPEVEAAFSSIVESREAALQFIEAELAAGRRPTGAAVDRVAKQVLTARGFAAAMRHRTGHGIDSDVHGSGVNIDSVEFTDLRLLLDGACFSLEPGVYLPNFGMRTEINVYIKDGKHFVSGKERQTALLRCTE